MNSNIEEFDLKSIKKESVQLYNTLSSKRKTFLVNENEINVLIANKPIFNGYKLTCQLGDSTFQFVMSKEQLQSFFKPWLQGVSFELLPKLLRLECVKSYIDLVFQSDCVNYFNRSIEVIDIETYQQEMVEDEQLVVTIKNEQTILYAWVLSSTKEMIALLPEQQNAVVKQVKVNIGFMLGHARLSLSQLKGLAIGDVVLFDDNLLSNKQAILKVNGQYMHYCQINDELTFKVIDKEVEMIMDNKGIDLDKMQVYLSFEMNEKKVTLKDIESIQVGHVFEMSAPNHSAISVKVNDDTLAYGELVRIEDKLGVRITSTSDVDVVENMTSVLFHHDNETEFAMTDDLHDNRTSLNDNTMRQEVLKKEDELEALVNDKATSNTDSDTHPEFVFDGLDLDKEKFNFDKDFFDKEFNFDLDAKDNALFKRTEDNL